MVPDSIPPLTRGAYLVDRLVQTTTKGCQNTRDSNLLRDMAAARKELQDYLTKLEKVLGLHGPLSKHPGGHADAKGFSVGKTRNGKKWRLVMTSIMDGRPHHVCQFDTKAEAEQVGREMVARFRKPAA